MPFLRLIIIYIIVFAIAFAIFNREKVMQLAGYSMEESAQEEIQEAVAEEQEVDEEPAEVSETVSETPIVEDVAKEQPVAKRATAVANLTTRLDEVRNVYWKGDVKKAETLYVAMADEFDMDANIQGETGNFFYSQRRFEEAAKYFHNAGLLLLKSGNKQQVMSIINALQGISPEKAADLRARAAK